MDELENLSSQQENEEDAGVVTGEETETAPEDSVPEKDNAPEVANGAKEKQSRKENNRYADARRAGKEEGAKEERERINKMLKRQGIPNPAAEGKKLESIEEIEEYGIAYRAAQREVDPSVIREEDEVRSWKEERDAEAARTAATEAEQAAMQKDREDFTAKYPEVNLEELAKSKSFELFGGASVGREPLASIYKRYCEFMADYEPKAKPEKSERSTGTGGTAATPMTGDQMRELQRWNERYPELKMTEEEFLRRKG